MRKGRYYPFSIKKVLLRVYINYRAMKIKEYDTNELLMIANNVTGEYSDKKVRQAKEEQKLYFTYKNIHPISTIQ